MNRLAVAMILVLALVGCTGAPMPKEPVEADRAPCIGDRFYEGAKNYARCIKNVAAVATRCSRFRPACVSIDG
jgi:hypothetical protein